MIKLDLKLKIRSVLPIVYRYLKEHQLIYIGIILCNICCFNFHRIFDDKIGNNLFFGLIVFTFFIVSFISPLVLGLIFTAKSFIANTKNQLLSNIIHSYIGTILIFASLFYQCSVLGDFNDSINKQTCYDFQVKIKKNNPDLTIMRVADQRAFKGIKARIWSGYDYPDKGLLYGPNRNPDFWLTFIKNNYDELSIEQIERIANNKTEYSKAIEYQKQNVKDVYIDCLYFSVVCIATVGFGDITPNLPYSKLFTAFEIIIGLSIFVFAIGMLFSKWTIDDEK